MPPELLQCCGVELGLETSPRTCTHNGGKSGKQMSNQINQREFALGAG
jgi:hypothetical protein